LGPERSLWYISDLTVRPLPDPTQINFKELPPIQVFKMVPGYFSTGADVHQTFLGNHNLIMISELTQNRKQWFLQVYYGPEKDIIIGATRVPFMYVASVPPLLPIHFTEVIGNIGHPHYTNLLIEPYLFFARFPTWNLGGSRRYAHEIWATRIDPDRVFNPWGKLLVAGGTREEIYVIRNIIPLPTSGAKTATIYLFGVAAAGTLTITESSSPYHIWAETGIRVQSTQSVSAGANKIIWDRPAPWMALGIDQDLSEWMIILDCR